MFYHTHKYKISDVFSGVLTFPNHPKSKRSQIQATIATATMDTMATMAEGVPAVLLPLAGMHLGYVPAIGGFQVPPVDR